MRRVRQYADRKGLVLAEPLGAGIHGSVFAAVVHVKRLATLAAPSSRHDHYVPGIMFLDRLAEGLDPFGASLAERNEQHLIFLQVDNVI
jgi:hypothetical protein